MPTKAEILAKKEARWTLYCTAEEKILSGAQSYEIGTRSFTMADLGEIKKTIQRLEAELIRWGKGFRVRRAVPRSQ